MHGRVKTKLDCSSPEPAPAFVPKRRRLTRALSPQCLPRQAARKPIPAASLRLPVSAANRATLKAMRQAELAAWSGVSPLPVTQPAAVTAIVRLPSASADSSEGRLHLLLAGLCTLVLGYLAWATWRHAPGWLDFVEYVRQLLA